MRTRSPEAIRSAGSSPAVMWPHTTFCGVERSVRTTEAGDWSAIGGAVARRIGGPYYRRTPSESLSQCGRLCFLQYLFRPISIGVLRGEPWMQKNQPYSGYQNHPPQGDDPLLTRVGPGTPGGEYLRRYWHPFMLASELADLPVALKLLGEDLVVFRDKSGRLGLLHKHCAHRGASLEFGIIADRGIRCCYHGWHFDVDGTILDTPAEPPTSRIKHNFCQGAYHVREEHGLLFAYMGPPESVPDFPYYDTFSDTSSTVAPFKLPLPCNWVQIVENAADPIHNAFLHAIVSGQQFSPAFKVLPVLDFVETPLGFLSMATRKVGDFVFIRAG